MRVKGWENISSRNKFKLFSLIISQNIKNNNYGVQNVKNQSFLNFLHIFILNSRDYLIIKLQIILDNLFKEVIAIDLEVAAVIGFVGCGFAFFGKFDSLVGRGKVVLSTSCNENRSGDFAEKFTR